MRPSECARSLLQLKEWELISRQIDGLQSQHLTLSVLGPHGAVLLPPIASVDRRSGLPWFWIGAAMAIEEDYMVDDVTTVNASQGWDPVSSLVDDLGYSEAGTAGALHNLSLVTRL
jgi:hypothetical protein